jgi:hypothetical protein
MGKVCRMPQSGASGADSRHIVAHIPLHLRPLKCHTANLYTFFTRHFLTWRPKIHAAGMTWA